MKADDDDLKAEEDFEQGDEKLTPNMLSSPEGRIRAKQIAERQLAKRTAMSNFNRHRKYKEQRRARDANGRRVITGRRSIRNPLVSPASGVAGIGHSPTFNREPNTSTTTRPQPRRRRR